MSNTKVKKVGSPLYQIKLPALAAGDYQTYDFQYPNDTAISDINLFVPVDYVQVINNDAVDLMLIVNQTQKIIVPASTIQKWENKPVWNISIQNQDSATTTTLGKVWINVQKKPVSMNELIREAF